MKKGFTLIELLVVVLIIGILAAVALPQYNKSVMESRATEILTFVGNVVRAIDIMVVENGGVPAAMTLADLPIDYTNVVTCTGPTCTANNGKWSANLYPYGTLSAWMLLVTPDASTFGTATIDVTFMPDGTLAYQCTYAASSSKGKTFCDIIKSLDKRYTVTKGS